MIRIQTTYICSYGSKTSFNYLRKTTSNVKDLGGFFNAWSDPWVRKLCWIFSLLLCFCLHNSSLRWRWLSAVSQLSGLSPAWSRAAMGTLAALNGEPDTAPYARPAAPTTTGADKLEVSFSCLLLLLLGEASSGRPRADRERAGDDYINQCQGWELWFMNMHNELSPLRRTS